MDLKNCDIIKGPVISDKAYKLNKNGQVMLYVHMHANKLLIKRAVEKLFSVKTVHVNTEIRPGKSRRAGRKVVSGSMTKVAYVTLADGYKLDVFNQAVTGSSDVEVAQSNVQEQAQ